VGRKKKKKKEAKPLYEFSFTETGDLSANFNRFIMRVSHLGGRIQLELEATLWMLNTSLPYNFIKEMNVCVPLGSEHIKVGPYS
jgi:hypothetical protein